MATTTTAITTPAVDVQIFRNAPLVTETDLRPADWNRIMDEELDSIWLVLHKGGSHDRFARGWTMTFLTTSEDVITLYPKAADDTGRINIVLDAYTKNMAPAGSKTGYSWMMASAVNTYGRLTLPNTSLRMMLDRIRTSGLHRYRLVDGRGSRMWLCMIVFALHALIKETTKPYNHLPFLMIKHFCWCYTQNNNNNDNNDNVAESQLLDGKIMPHQLGKIGYEAYTEVKARFGEIRKREEMFGA